MTFEILEKDNKGDFEVGVKGSNKGEFGGDFGVILGDLEDTTTKKVKAQVKDLRDNKKIYLEAISDLENKKEFPQGKANSEIIEYESK